MTHNIVKVTFHRLHSSYRIPGSKSIKQFLQAKVQKAKKGGGSLKYVFVDDGYLLKMNTEFLNHNSYTDIITFDLSDGGSKIDGEIYISIDRVKENATQYKVPFADELKRVIFHGLLHLFGYKDKSAADQKLMRGMEDKWLREFAKRST
jgi:probable rRNA maturation factor